MSERGITMCGSSVTAILAGRKTQTRRVIVPQPKLRQWETDKVPVVVWRKVTWPKLQENPRAWNSWCPYGIPGDLLYVRETYYRLRPEHRADNHHSHCIYKADSKDWDASRRELGYKWKSGRFMPKVAARLWLKILDVHVQRVQDITETDAEAEGFARWLSEHCWEGWSRNPDGSRSFYSHGAGHDPDNPAPPQPGMKGAERIVKWTSAKESFAVTWDSLNAKRGYGWAANPWVWAISFEQQPAGDRA